MKCSIRQVFVRTNFLYLKSKLLQDEKLLMKDLVKDTVPPKVEHVFAASKFDQREASSTIDIQVNFTVQLTLQNTEKTHKFIETKRATKIN